MKSGYRSRLPKRRNAVAAGEEKPGRLEAEQSKYYRLYLRSGNVAIAAMYLRRVRVAGRSFAAAMPNVLTVVTPPAPAAQTLGESLRRTYRG